MHCRRFDHKWSAETRCYFHLVLTCVSCDHSLIHSRKRPWKMPSKRMQQTAPFWVRLFKKSFSSTLHIKNVTQSAELPSYIPKKTVCTLIRIIMVIYRHHIKTARTICFSWCFVSFKYAFFPRSGQKIIQKYSDSLSCTSQSGITWKDRKNCDRLNSKEKATSTKNCVQVLNKSCFKGRRWSNQIISSLK